MLTDVKESYLEHEKTGKMLVTSNDKEKERERGREREGERERSRNSPNIAKKLRENTS